ncbi:MAG: hypothetical protein LBM98_08005 [Oscillospiraceae bacterium]|jgi:hypothetical protein|nr:hypothetical protein [Oscillospiraceae bacterium]
MIELAQRVLALTNEQEAFIKAGDTDALNDSLDKRKELLDELAKAGELPEAARALLREAEKLNDKLALKAHDLMKSYEIEFAKAKRGLEKVSKYEAAYSAVETEFSRSLDVEG